MLLCQLNPFYFPSSCGRKQTHNNTISSACLFWMLWLLVTSLLVRFKNKCILLLLRCSTLFNLQQPISTSLLVEDGHAGRWVLRVPEANRAISWAGSETMVNRRIRQTPDAVLVAVQHAALNAGIWRDSRSSLKLKTHTWREDNSKTPVLNACVK